MKYFQVLNGLSIEFNDVHSFAQLMPLNGCEDYLTAGRLYDAAVDKDGDFLIVDDMGVSLLCLRDDLQGGCSHSPNGYNMFMLMPN